MPRNRPQSERVPAEPFARWIRLELDRIAADRDGSPLELLGLRLGITERAVRRYRDGLSGSDLPRGWFRRRRIEDMLDHAGVAFWDVYPDVAAAEDMPLEPAAWCSCCGETVSPLRGVCPWCDTRLSEAA